MRKLKILLLLLLSLALLGAGGFYALQSRYVAQRLKSLIAASIATQLNAEASIDSLVIDPLQNKISINKLSIAVPGYSPFFTMGAAEIDIDPWPLLTGTLAISTLTITQPELSLAVSKTGGSNLPSPTKSSGGSSAFSVRVDRVKVINGSVQVSFPEALFAEAQGISVLVDRSDSGYDIAVNAKTGGLDVPRIHERVQNLNISARYEGGAFTLRDFSLKTDSLQTKVSGEALSANKANGGGSLELPITLLGGALGEPTTDGTISAAFSLSGALSSPTATARFTFKDALWSWYKIGSPTISLRLEGDVLHIVSLRLPLGAGEILVDGSIKLRGSLPIELHVQSKNIEYAELLEHMSIPNSWIATTFSNEMFLEGQLLDGFYLKTKANQPGRGVFRNFQMTPYSFRQTTNNEPYIQYAEFASEAAVTILTDRVELSNGLNIIGKTKLQYSGYITYAHHIDLQFQGFVDLAEAGMIAGVAYTGAGAIHNGRMSGILWDPTISADINYKNFSFDTYPMGDVTGRMSYRYPALAFSKVSGSYKSVNYRSDGEIDFSTNAMQTRFESEILQGNLRDVAEMMLLGDYVPTGVTGTIKATNQAKGPLYTMDTTTQATFEGLSIYGEKLERAEATFRYRLDGDFFVDKATLYKGSGSITAAGSYLLDGSFTASLRSTMLRSSELNSLDLASLGLSTRYSFSLDASGDFDDPRVSAAFFLESTSLKKLSLDPSRLTLEVAQNTASINGTLFGEGQLETEVKLSSMLPFELKLSLPELALQRFFPELSGAVATAQQGTLSLSGELQAPKKIKGDLAFSSVSASLFGISAASEGAVSVTLQEETLQIAPVKLTGDNGAFAFQIAGEYHLPTEKASLSLASAFDLASIRELPVVAAMLPADITAITGTATTSGKLELDHSGYHLWSEAHLADFSFSLSSLPHPLEDLDVDLTITDRAIWIDRLTGNFAGGSLWGDGEVELDGLTAKKLRFALALKGAEIRRPQDGISASLDADVTLQGRPDNLRVEGLLDINDFLYNKEVEIVPSLGDLLTQKAAPSINLDDTPQTASTISLDLELKNSGSIRIENNLVTAELQIDSAVRPFQIRGDVNKPEFLGNIVLVRDEEDPAKITLLDRELNLSRAVFDFDGPLNPSIDVVTETKIRDFDITIRGTGTVEKPKVLYSSSPSLSEEDIILLLTLGITRREASDANSLTRSLVTSELLSQVTGLDEQVNRLLPEKVEVNLTTGFSEIQNSFVPKLQVKWDPSDNIRFRAASNVLSLSQENSAELLWFFDDNLSFAGSWNQQGDTLVGGFSVGDLGLDLKWRLEF
jgi:hypothetical protein